SLKLISIPPPPIRTTFSEENIHGSYELLGNECLDLYNQSFNNIIKSFLELEIDLKYSNRILGLDKEIKDKNLESLLDSNLQQLNSIKNDLSSNVFSNPSEDNIKLLTDITEKVKSGWESYKIISKDLRNIQAPAEVNKNAKELLSIISIDSSKNLKDIILNLSEKKNMDLDNILNLLRDCFKSRQIDIIVKRKN
ncbi:MAG: hypothetical protein ACFFDN_51055, partial [Candidatus Hodarchaeota archaeon]